jgi:hypothetical protein
MEQKENTTYMTEKEARANGFRLLAGPFLNNDMQMAHKIANEVKQNNKLAALVERIRGKRKHYEVWQKSLTIIPNKL